MFTYVCKKCGRVFIPEDSQEAFFNSSSGFRMSSSGLHPIRNGVVITEDPSIVLCPKCGSKSTEMAHPL